MTNLAKFDVDDDGEDYGYQLVSAQDAVLKLRLNPAQGVQRVQFQVYDPNAFDADQGNISKNPPRSSGGAPTVTLDNEAGSTGQAVNAATPTSGVTFPGQTGVHSWIVRCVVNGGYRAGPNGIPIPDPDLVWERMLYLEGPIAGTRKLVATESTQGSLEGWAEVINAMIAVGGATGEANTASNLAGGDVGIFKTKSSLDLQFRPLEGIGGISIALAGDVIQIDGSGIAGGVESFNSRTGAVVPAASDYDSSQVDDDSTYGGGTQSVATSIDDLKTEIDGKSATGHNHDHGALTGLTDVADHPGYSTIDGSRAYTNPVSGVTPTADAHLATKAYVDALAQGLDVKPSVRAVATSNQATRSGTAQTIDGFALNTVGMRVLLTAQSTASQNGIWVVQSGAWTRPTDFDTGDGAAGAFTFVESGTSNADSGWVCTSNTGSDVIDTNSLAWTQFSGAGQITAGNGLTKSGNTINAVANGDGSIMANADDLQVGVLATDAQHGVRGGGTQHAVATASVAGFMPANFIPQHSVWTASATTGDNQQASASTLSATPYLGQWPSVRVGALTPRVGDITAPCYWSGDSGATARTNGAVASGDKLYWNQSVAGGALSGTEVIEVVYS